MQKAFYARTSECIIFGHLKYNMLNFMSMVYDASIAHTFILMYFSTYIDTMSVESFILYFKGLSVKMSKDDMLLSLKISFLS